jgi:large subunit ribosomal protein L1
MAKLTKRAKAIREQVEPGKVYAPEDAFTMLKTLSTVKFIENVDVAVNLGVDPRKSDQVVRGAAVLPHGTGKDVRVAVFTQGANADADGGGRGAGRHGRSGRRDEGRVAEL